MSWVKGDVSQSYKSVAVHLLRVDRTRPATMSTANIQNRVVAAAEVKTFPRKSTMQPGGD
jgi:hypothetical protein